MSDDADAAQGTEAGDGRPMPLADLRVVDMSTVIAGPGCARYLADFGADVIKVERPGGDGTRRMGWIDPDDGVAFWWKLLGRGKRSVVLDLKDRRPVSTPCAAWSPPPTSSSRTSARASSSGSGCGPTS